MFETVLLKPFSSSPPWSGGVVNGWCLVGFADSQGDGDKSPEPRGAEQRRPESAGKL